MREIEADDGGETAGFVELVMGHGAISGRAGVELTTPDGLCFRLAAGWTQDELRAAAMVARLTC